MQKKPRKCQTQVPWTKDRVELFIDLAMLNDDEAYIMRTRVKKVPVSKQAEHLGYAESTIHSMIAKLKKKYDVVQAELGDPKRLPPRKFSEEEVWMDSH